MTACVPVQLNDSEMWALVEDSKDGVRLRVSLDDWERACLRLGQRVLARITGRPDASFYVADADEQPPLVWATLTPRLFAETW